MGTWATCRRLLASCKRFSLRTLLLITTVCCLLLAAWAAYVNVYWQQAGAVEEIRRLNGQVEEVPADGPIWQRWLVSAVLGSKAYRHATSVYLTGAHLDDNVIRSLRALPFLRKLNVIHSHVPDEAASALRSLPRLETLSLRYSDVSDSGLKNVPALPKLTTLYLTGTRVSDAAIPDLTKFPSLAELFIRWTDISEAGAQQLREKLPGCSVYYHPLTEETAAEVNGQ